MRIVVVGVGLGGLLGLVYLVLVAFVAHRFTTPRRVLPPPIAPDQWPGFVRVTFPARVDALPIVAWYRPVAQATRAVIMVHGRDSHRGDVLAGETLALAARLAERGLSVLLIDLRGHGESGAARLTFGHHELRDVLGGVDFLRSQGHLPGCIGLFGASLGGATCIAAAAQEPAVGALVLDSAYADLHALLLVTFTRLTRLPTWCLGGALTVANRLTGVRLTSRAPHTLMRELRGRPMLIVHAADDPFVPVRHALVLARAGQAGVWITRGTRHLSSASVEGSRYAERITRFLAHALETSNGRGGLVMMEFPPPGHDGRARGTRPREHAAPRLAAFRRNEVAALLPLLESAREKSGDELAEWLDELRVEAPLVVAGLEALLAEEPGCPADGEAGPHPGATECVEGGGAATTVWRTPPVRSA